MNWTFRQSISLKVKMYFKALLLVGIVVQVSFSTWHCNELEKKINNERRRYGMKDLLCDQHMRWTANQHVEDQADAGFNGFNQADKSCNLHSWFSKYSCCYRSGADNGGCMTDKPFVSILGAIVFSCYNIIIMT